MELHVGTQDGLYQFGDGQGKQFEGESVTALAAADSDLWAITERTTVWHLDGGSWQQAARVEGLGANCLLPSRAGVLVGTSEAHLLRLTGTNLEGVASFEAVEGRAKWYTPWGGPPDTRSLAEDPIGKLYVNVHVGGVLVSTDGGASWDASGVDIHTDVHQVVAPGRDLVLVAAGEGGLGVSKDGGRSWQLTTEGLHAAYCRSVAVSEDYVLLTASTGPRTSESAVYRRPSEEDGPFERCRNGLPSWFTDNIDSGCLDAVGGTVAFGTTDGSVFLSADQGQVWKVLSQGLPPVTSVTFRRRRNG